MVNRHYRLMVALTLNMAASLLAADGPIELSDTQGRKQQLLALNGKKAGSFVLTHVVAGIFKH